MKFRIFMATATAASVLMTVGAMAANTNYLDQDGSFNSASIDQDAGEGNNVGVLATPATQDGDRNSLTVEQLDASSLGVPVTGYMGGVKQSLDRNILTVTQNKSVTHQVLQTGVSGATSTTNQLSISQTLAGFTAGPVGNTLRSVTQIYDGVAGGSDRNEATISQVRTTVGFQHPNLISTVKQDGRDNQLLVTQNGGFHYIETVLQDGVGNEATLTQLGYNNSTRKLSQVGDNNEATLILDGSGNDALLTPSLPALRPTDYMGFGHSYNDNAALRQVGTDNRAGLHIIGNNNGYAVFQDGDSNRAEDIVVTGNTNQIAIAQYFGNLNTIDLASVDGDANVVVLRQGSRPTGSGDSNKITGSVLDSNNVVLVDQIGDSNRTTFSQSGGNNDLMIVALGDLNTLNAYQSGGSNAATVNVEGSSNFLDVTQDNTGVTGNTLTASIFGNSNNASGSFSGAAGTAAGSLTRGQITQTGSGHEVTLTVGTALADADFNRFAFSQNGGSNNEISAEIYGSSNQVVVTQIGTSNVSYTLQTGGSNNIGVQQ